MAYAIREICRTPGCHAIGVERRVMTRINVAMGGSLWGWLCRECDDARTVELALIADTEPTEAPTP